MLVIAIEDFERIQPNIIDAFATMCRYALLKISKLDVVLMHLSSKHIAQIHIVFVIGLVTSVSALTRLRRETMGMLGMTVLTLKPSRQMLDNMLYTLVARDDLPFMWSEEALTQLTNVYKLTNDSVTAFKHFMRVYICVLKYLFYTQY